MAKAELDISAAVGRRVLVAGSWRGGYYNLPRTIIPAFFNEEKAVVVLRKVPYTYEDGCGANHRALVKTDAVFKGGYKVFPEEDGEGHTIYVRNLPHGRIVASWASWNSRWYASFRGWFVFEARKEDDTIVLRPSKEEEWDLLLLPLWHRENSRVSCTKLYYHRISGFSAFATASTCCRADSNAVALVLAEKGATFLVGRKVAFYRERPEEPIEVYRFTALSDFSGEDPFHEMGGGRPYKMEYLGFFRSIEDAAESLELEEVV